MFTQVKRQVMRGDVNGLCVRPLAGLVLGLSTRKVGETLVALLDRPVSAQTVSRVARTLDAAVAVFHRRPLKGGYKELFLDRLFCRGRPAPGR